MAKVKGPITLENFGSLITYKDDDGDNCLGFLMHFKGHGVYDPTFGKVDVPPEFIDQHNQCLSAALIRGLDENCEIGQGGTFYTDKTHGTVKTFIGELVSSRTFVRGKTLTFERNGKTFRGRLTKGDCFNFRRIS